MSYKLNKEIKSPYEQMEDRFKLFSSELTHLNGQLESAEESTKVEVGPDWYEKQTVLRDNIDVLLRRVIELGYVKSEPLEEKMYPVTFPGRFNGKLRKTW